MNASTPPARLLRGLALALGALLAACGGGEARDPEPEAAIWLEEAAASRGLDFHLESGHDEEYLMPELMSGGAALFDMDGDGDLDAYLVQSGDMDGGGDAVNRLYRNDGTGHFEDVTEGSGAGDAGYGNGVACGDADGDGDTDLYVANLGPNVLLLNDGTGRFTDVTESAGVGDPAWGTSAAFLDSDGDGDLDLFVVNYLDWSPEIELACFDSLSRPDYCSPKNYSAPSLDTYYENVGGGRFEDRSEASGIRTVRGTGLGIGCADFDDDGDLDVFVANDGMPDRLWVGAGDGTFKERGMRWGCAVDLDGLEKAGMGVALGDIDGDLAIDLMVCNVSGESDSVFRNAGGFFQDVTASIGIAGPSKSLTRFGMAWVDLDHDGLFDLYQANGRVLRAHDSELEDPYAEENLLLRGTPGGRFEVVEPSGGTARPLFATSRAAAFGDVDGDGAIDILVVNRDAPAHLFLNRVAAGKPAVLFSVLEPTGAHALGAKLAIRAGGRTIRRDVMAAYSYQASNDPRVHLALPGVERIDEVVVRWVDGGEDRFGPFELAPEGPTLLTLRR